MKCRIFAAILASIWMIFILNNANAYPEVMSGMNKLSGLDEASAQGCSFGTWLECGTVVFRCASSCVNLNVPKCYSCAGSSYNTCKDCFSRQELLQSEMQGIVPVMNKDSNLDQVTAQGCGWRKKLKCGGTVAKCAAKCGNLNAPECISCAGNSYNKCKGCF